jgi:hypothetical protein
MEYWGVRKAGVACCLLRVRRMGMVAAQDFVLVLVVVLVLEGARLGCSDLASNSWTGVESLCPGGTE